MENRNCEYRNCINQIDFTKRRTDSKYCSNKCKENERTYLKRERRKDRENKKHIVDNIIQIEKNKEIIDLFVKIYNK
jgi:hypothetical protein